MCCGIGWFKDVYIALKNHFVASSSYRLIESVLEVESPYSKRAFFSAQDRVGAHDHPQRNPVLHAYPQNGRKRRNLAGEQLNWMTVRHRLSVLISCILRCTNRNCREKEPGDQVVTLHLKPSFR